MIHFAITGRRNGKYDRYLSISHSGHCRKLYIVSFFVEYSKPTIQLLKEIRQPISRYKSKSIVSAGLSFLGSNKVDKVHTREYLARDRNGTVVITTKGLYITGDTLRSVAFKYKLMSLRVLTRPFSQAAIHTRRFCVNFRKIAYFAFIDVPCERVS